MSFWASSKSILTFTKWGGVACEITSVHGPQCNFRPRNTTSVCGQQLPSTSAQPRYLIHCFQHEWAKNRCSKRGVFNSTVTLANKTQQVSFDQLIHNYFTVIQFNYARRSKALNKTDLLGSQESSSCITLLTANSKLPSQYLNNNCISSQQVRVSRN